MLYCISMLHGILVLSTWSYLRLIVVLSSHVVRWLLCTNGIITSDLRRNISLWKFLYFCFTFWRRFSNSSDRKYFDKQFRKCWFWSRKLESFDEDWMFHMMLIWYESKQLCNDIDNGGIWLLLSFHTFLLSSLLIFHFSPFVSFFYFIFILLLFYFYHIFIHFFASFHPFFFRFIAFRCNDTDLLFMILRLKRLSWAQLWNIACLHGHVLLIVCLHMSTLHNAEWWAYKCCPAF